MHRISIWIGVFLWMILVHSCSNKKGDVAPKPIRITLLLKDRASNVIQGAKAYLFENELDYKLAAEGKAIQNALDSSLSLDSKVEFDIKPNVSYWLYIQYQDLQNRWLLTNESYKNIITDLPANSEFRVEV